MFGEGGKGGEKREVGCKIMKSTSIIQGSKEVSKPDKGKSRIFFRNMEVTYRNKWLLEKVAV